MDGRLGLCLAGHGPARVRVRVQVGTKGTVSQALFRDRSRQTRSCWKASQPSQWAPELGRQPAAPSRVEAGAGLPVAHGAPSGVEAGAGLPVARGAQETGSTTARAAERNQDQSLQTEASDRIPPNRARPRDTPTGQLEPTPSTSNALKRPRKRRSSPRGHTADQRHKVTTLGKGSEIEFKTHPGNKDSPRISTTDGALPQHPTPGGKEEGLKNHREIEKRSSKGQTRSWRAVGPARAWLLEPCQEGPGPSGHPPGTVTGSPH